MKMGKRESSPGGKVTTGVIYECYNGDPAQQSITEQKPEGLLNRDVANHFKSKWHLYERKQETCSYCASYFIINVDIYIWFLLNELQILRVIFSSSRSKTIKQVVD